MIRDEKIIRAFKLKKLMSDTLKPFFNAEIKKRLNESNKLFTAKDIPNPGSKVTFKREENDKGFALQDIKRCNLGFKG